MYFKFSQQNSGAVFPESTVDAVVRCCPRNVIFQTSPGHTYAVLYLQAGDDIKTLQENLGHDTAAFTLSIYGHVTDKMRQDSARRMNQYLVDIVAP